MASIPVEKKPIKDLLAEKDAFLSGSDRLYEYFLRHTRAFIALGAAIALIVIAWAAYNKYEARAEARAAEAYENALSAMAASPDKAALELEAVRENFKGRKAARLAAYTLLSICSAKNETLRAISLAEELMRALPAPEAALKPVLLADLAGLYEAEKKYDEAAAAHESLMGLAPGQPDLRRGSLLALGRINAARGRTDEAVNNYKALINEFPGNMEAYMANGILTSLTGRPQTFPGNPAAE